MDQRSTSVDRYAEQNRVVSECLNNEQKLKSMNDTMARTIATEVYDFSLARVLLLPHLCYGDGYSPVYQGADDGPAVMVNLVRKETRVLHCRAFRDSLREEETVTTVQDLEFLAIRGRVRPSSFTISNVCTAKRMELERRPFSMVERARQRLRYSLAQDETRLAIRALAWVCAKFGRRRWCARDSASLSRMLTEAVEHAGLHRSPVILCSPLTFATLIRLRAAVLSGSPQGDRPNAPFAAIMVRDTVIPIYVNQAVPAHTFFICPSGEALGQMPIFTEATVVNYDRPERWIKGWSVAQEQGMVFVSPRATSMVFVGKKGLWLWVRSLFRWGPR